MGPDSSRDVRSGSPKLGRVGVLALSEAKGVVAVPVALRGLVATPRETAAVLAAVFVVPVNVLVANGDYEKSKGRRFGTFG